MNKVTTSIIIRFLILGFLQGLVLIEISIEINDLPYFQTLLYPLLILVIPFSVSRPTQLVLAFFLGLLVDMYYDSPGIHAAALVFTAYIRPYVLSWVEPRESYNIKDSPTKGQYGLAWFMRYSSTLIAIHLFTYFSIEAFTFYFIIDIILKTVSSFLITMLFILMSVFIMRD